MPGGVPLFQVTRRNWMDSPIAAVTAAMNMYTRKKMVGRQLPSLASRIAAPQLLQVSVFPGIA